ncbi:MAG: hypothetical protein JWM14_3352 [Chitinophagaceae bacterium]|nr:hypothetical protein [Chitinophagaceae bacterium]
MQLLSDTINFTATYFIRGLFISVLLVLLVKLFFKQKINTHHAVLILKWIILSYTFLFIIKLITQFLFPIPSESFQSFTSRAFGPYYWAYWSMFFFSTLFPLLLLFKKWGHNVYFLLLVSVFLNIGWLFESFVVHMTSLHREFGTMHNPYLPFDEERMILLYGFCLGITALVLGKALAVLLPSKQQI